MLMRTHASHTRPTTAGSAATAPVRPTVGDTMCEVAGVRHHLGEDSRTAPCTLRSTLDAGRPHRPTTATTRAPTPPAATQRPRSCFPTVARPATARPSVAAPLQGKSGLAKDSTPYQGARVSRAASAARAGDHPRGSAAHTATEVLAADEVVDGLYPGRRRGSPGLGSGDWGVHAHAAEERRRVTGTFLTERLFAGVLVAGTRHHRSQLLQRVLRYVPDGGGGGGARASPLIAAMSTLLHDHGLRSVDRATFKPLLTAAFAACEGREGGVEHSARGAPLPGWESWTQMDAGDGGLAPGTATGSSTSWACDSCVEVPRIGEAAVIEESEYEYLFRFLDWEGTGVVKGNVLLARLSLAYHPACLVSSSIFVYLLFLRHAHGAGRLPRLSTPSTAGQDGGEGDEQSDVDPDASSLQQASRTMDLFALQRVRLSLLHQQLLITLRELAEMLNSVVEAYLALRLRAVEAEQRRAERKEAEKLAADRAATRSQRPSTALDGLRSPSNSPSGRGGGMVSPATHGSSAVAQMGERRRLARLRRQREAAAKRRGPSAAAVAEAQRGEAVAYAEGVLRPACQHVVQRCVAIHDGNFCVSVGQLRAELFQSPVLISVLGEIAGFYLAL